MRPGLKCCVVLAAPWRAWKASQVQRRVFGPGPAATGTAGPSHPASASRHTSLTAPGASSRSATVQVLQNRPHRDGRPGARARAQKGRRRSSKGRLSTVAHVGGECTRRGASTAAAPRLQAVAQRLIPLTFCRPNPHCPFRAFSCNASAACAAAIKWGSARPMLSRAPCLYVAAARLRGASFIVAGTAYKRRHRSQLLSSV